MSLLEWGGQEGFPSFRSILRLSPQIFREGITAPVEQNPAPSGDFHAVQHFITI
jgi:hypothetical protein